MSKWCGACKDCMYFAKDKNNENIFCIHQEKRIDKEVNDCTDFRPVEWLTPQKHYLNNAHMMEGFQIPVKFVETKKHKKPIKK